jgi:rod shape-determining protein MreD
MQGLVKNKNTFSIKFFFPVILGLLLILIFRLPLRVEVIGTYMPFVSLIFVYYWVLNGRSYVPFGLVFLLGLFEDMVTMGPAGLNSIVLLAVAAGLVNQRRFFINQSFLVGWAGFCIICIGATFFRWMLESLYVSNFLSLWPLFTQALVTMLFYPILGAIFGFLRKRLKR